jgi:hypothetical protein
MMSKISPPTSSSLRNWMDANGHKFGCPEFGARPQPTQTEPTWIFSAIVTPGRSRRFGEWHGYRLARRLDGGAGIGMAGGPPLGSTDADLVMTNFRAYLVRSNIASLCEFVGQAEDGRQTESLLDNYSFLSVGTAQIRQGIILTGFGGKSSSAQIGLRRRYNFENCHPETGYHKHRSFRLFARFDRRFR